MNDAPQCTPIPTKEPGIWHCPNCGHRNRRPSAKPFRKNCVSQQGDPLACTHRGAIVREVECQLCGGPRLVAIYACALHGECSLARTKSGRDYRCCLTCGDRAN